jgi:RHS repeat-associated protein
MRELRTPALTDTYNFAGLGVGTTVPPGPDAPTTVTTNTTTKPYIYDQAGRLTSKALGAESFEYNVPGQLVRVLRSGVQAEALVYGPFGQLLGRVSGTTVTYYLDGRATVTATALAGCTSPGCAIDASTLKVDMHIRAGPRVASVRLQGGALRRVLYYHRDRLGSVVATSLGGGSVGASYRFGPWGDTRVAQADAGDAASEQGFAGAIRLSGSLLVMGVRVYDSELRQFIQPDPLDPMMYTYVGGDPINRKDPTGLGDVHEDRALPRLAESFFLTYGLEDGWEGYGLDVLRAHMPGAAGTPLQQFMDELLLGAIDVIDGHQHQVWTYYPLPCVGKNCSSELVQEWVRDPPSLPLQFSASTRSILHGRFDYVTVGVGWFYGLGGGVHITVDRNGYVTLGPAVGIGAGGKGFGVALGSYLGEGGEVPTGPYLRTLDTGWSTNISVAAGPGIGWNFPWGSQFMGVEPQVALPGAGVTVGRSWEIGRVEWLSW